MQPQVSVIIPVYNCQSFIGKAIESILSQDFCDFEVIVINDGSTDGTEAVIASYTDERIRYVKNEQNSGIVFTLNKGISLAKTPYIARMDADDFAYPDRLRLQYGFLEQRPDVAVCGAFLKIMDSNEIVRYPEHHQDIFFELLVSNVLAHPVVMFRKSVWKHYHLQYEERWFPAEDYMLWVKFAKYAKLHNLQLPLLEYKIHESSISVSQKATQIKRMNEIRCMHLLESLSLYSSENFSLLFQAFNFEFSNQLQYLKRLKGLLLKIVSANVVRKAFDSQKLNVFLDIYWYVACKTALQNGSVVLKTYALIPFFSKKNLMKLVFYYIRTLGKHNKISVY